jgi:D-aspartate ligase
MTCAGVVLGTNYNGLSIIQALGMRGIPCYAADSRRSVGTFSRYAHFWQVPDPQEDEEAFVETLVALLQRLKARPVVFPTGDQWAVGLARHAEELRPYARLCVGSRQAVELVVRKADFYEWAQEKGYPVPRSWSPAALSEIALSAYPLVAKPVYRRISSGVDTSHNAVEMDRMRFILLHNRDEAEAFVHGLESQSKRFVLQEFVPGKSDCMFTIGVYSNAQHECVGMFTGRKVRGFPADHGDCVVGEACSVPQELRDMTRRLVSDLALSGILEVEFKRDPDTGKYYLIEVNPRSWSWIGITPAAGVHLAWMAYQDLIGAPVACASSNVSDGTIRYAKVLQDFANSTVWYGDDYPPWRIGLRKWIRELREHEYVMAEFHARDWLVGLRAVAGLIVGSSKRMRNHRVRATAR